MEEPLVETEVADSEPQRRSGPWKLIAIVVVLTLIGIWLVPGDGPDLGLGDVHVFVVAVVLAAVPALGALEPQAVCVPGFTCHGERFRPGPGRCAVTEQPGQVRSE